MSGFITLNTRGWQVVRRQNADIPHREACIRNKREHSMRNSRALRSNPSRSAARENHRLHAQTVPPTVIFSIRNVGWPTPTGTLWPSLPHTPTPPSSAMSLPIMVTYLSDSGPLPISVAPFTGYVILPFSIMYASDAENTNLPLVMSTWPPPKFTAYKPFFTDARISPGSLSPLSMYVLVMRGMGSAAYDSRRALPVTGIFMRRAFSESWI